MGSTSAHDLLDGDSRSDQDDQYDSDHKANVASAPSRQLEMERHVMDLPHFYMVTWMNVDDRGMNVFPENVAEL